MSTQQQIDAWNAAIVQKQQEKAGQETILKVQQEQLKAAETARINADLAVQRAQSSGASTAQVEELQRQARLADSAESDARIAIGKTQSNIESLDGSIRFNTSNRDQFQAELPAQGNPASTADDTAVNAQSDAAEIAAAPVPAAEAPAPVPGSTQAEGNAGEAEAQARIEAENAAPVNDFVIDPVTGEQVPSDSDRADEIRAEQAAAEEQPETFGPRPIDTGDDAALEDDDEEFAENELTPEQQAANEQAEAKNNAINQATLNSVYKAAGSSDWRVRLQLAPTSDYLYNADPPGILAPLVATNGVIFPYTPQISTAYQAKYADYDLIHSNFRGVFYQNSRVDDVNIRAEFTAQDTNEANYLLAVIHFFRSVTKMFYGQDPQRGAPPPLVYLTGLGMDQFEGHPCLVRTFQYTLPNNVDYIRATNVNDYKTNLLSRRSPGTSTIGGVQAAGAVRLANALLPKGAEPEVPSPDSIVSQVNNTQLATYVPTKMEIDIVLIPVQTRSQVSKQFSLRDFANGSLIKNGFW